MIYDYKIKGVQGQEISMENYKGKVLLIVNTATGCGLTPQYEGLEKVYARYKSEGFEILDFPCNQFFEQAPGTDLQNANFCKVKYGTTFETFATVEVNGENTTQLYKFLKKEVPKAAEDTISNEFYGRLSSKGFNTNGNDIKWNFTKFLVDKKGNVVARFAPTYEPERVAEAIKNLL